MRMKSLLFCLEGSSCFNGWYHCNGNLMVSKTVVENFMFEIFIKACVESQFTGLRHSRVKNDVIMLDSNHLIRS